MFHASKGTKNNWMQQLLVVTNFEAFWFAFVWVKLYLAIASAAPTHHLGFLFKALTIWLWSLELKTRPDGVLSHWFQEPPLLRNCLLSLKDKPNAKIWKKVGSANYRTTLTANIEKQIQLLLTGHGGAICIPACRVLSPHRQTSSQRFHLQNVVLRIISARCVFFLCLVADNCLFLSCQWFVFSS